jgi:hypothetical protein
VDQNLLSQPARPLPEYAPGRASIVLHIVSFLIGALILLQAPRIVYEMGVGYFGDKISMKVSQVEDTFGKGGTVTFACRTPEGEEIESGVGTKTFKSFTVGQEFTGKIYPYAWGTSCVPESFEVFQPFGVAFIVMMIFMFGGAFFGEGSNFWSMLRIRRLLQTGASRDAVVRALTDKESWKRQLEWVNVEYEYELAGGKPIKGKVRLLDRRDEGWSFPLHNRRIKVLKAPQVGQRVRILYDEERPHQHMVIGFVQGE